ncbi:kunitz-type serine protease inhibitor 2-like [Haliotis rubra]|uniref:kunitz-type serine protease inhibitor 2-like n=1 Tax=Haliotis rubra TaxID=36100 RepID=UPI001EE5E0D6|nr:kunitz-type serine protease inhibitor 2-like [Haliotis rubra]
MNRVWASTVALLVIFSCVSRIDSYDIVCLLPPVSGHCHGAESRYYFDMFQSKCLIFPYSGCGGNSNNFKTEDECLKLCESPQLTPTPPHTGNGNHHGHVIGK